MLQRGFATERGKDHQVWVYSKDQPPRQTVTRKFGMEKFFYGPENSQADRNITRYENDNQSTIQQLRLLPNGEKVDNEFSATLISHLEVRSAFLREEMVTSFKKGMSGLGSILQKPDQLRTLYKKYLEANPEELEAFLRRNFIPDNKKAQAKRLIDAALDNMSDEAILASMGPAASMLRALTQTISEVAKDAQNRVLAENASGHVRMNLYRNFTYRIFRPNSGQLILPDTTLCFTKVGGAAPFAQERDTLEGVVLPLSSSVAIVGSKSEETSFNLKTLNRLLAACSFKSFIAKNDEKEFRSLSDRIGKYAKLIDDKALDFTVEDLNSSQR